MSKTKSSTTETILNIVMLIVLAGVLMWRYDNCKKKELATQQAQEKARAAEGEVQEKRINDCMSKAQISKRPECVRCTCTECLEEVENCARDKECSSLSAATIIAGGGPAPDSRARIRFDQRASCMLNKCESTCAAKP